jgi:hypothetical protein
MTGSEKDLVKRLLSALRLTKHDAERDGFNYGAQSCVVKAIRLAERYLAENVEPQKYKCTTCNDTGGIKLAPPRFHEYALCPNEKCAARIKILEYYSK